MSRHKINPDLPVLLVAVFGMASGAWAGIYKWVDEQGRVQFSDRPPVKGEIETVRLRPLNTYEVVTIEEPQDAVSREMPAAKTKEVVMYSASNADIAAGLKAVREEREKVKQALDVAQKELREVITLRQEAQLVLMGLLD